MAIINKNGITDGSTIQAEHVTRTIDALSGVSTDTIIATGSFTGSFTGLFSGTASYSDTAATASYISNAVSSSFATTASYAVSASYEINYETSSSYAETASIATSASYAVSASTSQTASYVLNAVSSSFAITASHTPNTIVQNGNSFGTTTVIGTNDNHALRFETNGIIRNGISSNGEVFLQTPDSASAATRIIRQPIKQTTTGLSVTTLDNFNVSLNSVFLIKAYVAAYSQSSGDIVAAMSGELYTHWYTDVLGAANQIGNSTYISSSIGFASDPRFFIDFIAAVPPLATGDVALQVQGQIGQTITWAGSLEYIKLV